MKKQPRLIIIEACDGAGKSTLVNRLNQLIPLSSVLKLSGAPKDIKKQEYMGRLYESLFDYLVYATQRQHLLLDRFTTSERVYAPIFKGYVPEYADRYETLLVAKTSVLQVHLEMSDELIMERLEKKRIECPNEKHPSFELAKRIRDRYNEVIYQQSKFETVKIDAALPVDTIAHKVMKLANIKQLVTEDAYSNERVQK